MTETTKIAYPHAYELAVVAQPARARLFKGQSFFVLVRLTNDDRV
jgi:hypothetical protein